VTVVEDPPGFRIFYMLQVIVVFPINDSILVDELPEVSAIGRAAIGFSQGPSNAWTFCLSTDAHVGPYSESDALIDAPRGRIAGGA